MSSLAKLCGGYQVSFGGVNFQTYETPDAVITGLFSLLKGIPEASQVQDFVVKNIQEKLKITSLRTGKVLVPEVSVSFRFKERRAKVDLLEIARSDLPLRFQPLGLLHLALLELEQRTASRFYSLETVSHGLSRLFWTKQHQQEIRNYNKKQSSLHREFKKLYLSGLLDITKDTNGLQIWSLTPKCQQILDNYRSRYQKASKPPKRVDLQLLKTFFEMVRSRSLSLASIRPHVYYWDGDFGGKLFKKVLVDHGLLTQDFLPTVAGLKLLSQNLSRYFSWRDEATFWKDRSPESIATIRANDIYLLSLTKDSWAILMSQLPNFPETREYLKTLFSQC